MFCDRDGYQYVSFRSLEALDQHFEKIVISYCFPWQLPQNFVFFKWSSRYMVKISPRTKFDGNPFTCLRYKFTAHTTDAWRSCIQNGYIRNKLNIDLYRQPITNCLYTKCMSKSENLIYLVVEDCVFLTFSVYHIDYQQVQHLRSS